MYGFYKPSRAFVTYKFQRRNVPINKIILVAAASDTALSGIRVAIWAGNIRAMNSLESRVLASDQVSQKIKTTLLDSSMLDREEFQCSCNCNSRSMLRRAARHGWLIVTVSTASPKYLYPTDMFQPGSNVRYRYSECSSYTDSWVNPRSVRRCNFACRTWIYRVYSE